MTWRTSLLSTPSPNATVATATRTLPLVHRFCAFARSSGSISLGYFPREPPSGTLRFRAPSTPATDLGFRSATYAATVRSYYDEQQASTLRLLLGVQGQAIMSALGISVGVGAFGHWVL